jgi:DNA-binding transcriptional LysR family regulator
MELRNLRALVALVKTGSFTLAAESLFVTQPTVSKLIAQLEEEFGHPLIQRGSRNIVLTEAGRLVLSHAEIMLNADQNLRLELAELGQLQRGTLRIGIPPLGPRLFVPWIGEYKRRYPGVELKLVEDGSRAIALALQARELELGGLLAPIDTNLFDYRTMIEDKLALVAPARSRWSKRAQVKLSELAEEPFVLFAEAFLLNDRILGACQQAGFVPQVAGRSSQIGFILELVSSGFGITLLPSSELQQLNRQDLAVSALIEPEILWRIDLAWLRDTYQSPAARGWLTMLAQAQ